MFYPADRPMKGLCYDEDHRLVECYNGHIMFSYSKKGNGMTVHFASDKSGLRAMKCALDSFCSFIFREYPWVDVIFGPIDKRRNGIKRLAVKCGFSFFTQDSKHDIYVRGRK